MMTRWKSMLRIRMMLSHTGVSVAAVLLLEILCVFVVFFVVVFSPLLDRTELGTRSVSHRLMPSSQAIKLAQGRRSIQK